MINREGHSTNRGIRFKTLILTSSLCDYSDGKILTKERIIITVAVDTIANTQADEKK